MSKIIELGLNGDVIALRVCIERLLPKSKREPIGIELPKNINQKNLPKLKDEILRAAFDGRISIDDAEKLEKLLTNEVKNDISYEITTDDPIEASKIYQKIMMESG